MNRIDRVSAILIQLQSKKVVKAQHIADRFNVSLRTIYRDIKSLEEAGIPVIGEAGAGYSLMEGYRLPPVMFTREEAISFITAEKLVEKLTDTANSKNFQSAMFKVRAVLRTAEKDLLEQIDNQVAVVRTSRQKAVEGNYTETILKAIAENKVISINYFSYYKKESNKREVEPVGIFQLDNHWHLIAYCLLRNDYRNFRFDRVSSMLITDKLQQRDHPPLKTYIGNTFKDHVLHPVTIIVNQYAFPYIGEQKYYMGYVDEKQIGDEVEMNFMSASLEGFARWFLLMGDHAHIVEPQLLRDKVRSLVQKISERF
jgi:predicted DNA-binding transcriptional regulator YafY